MLFGWMVGFKIRCGVWMIHGRIPILAPPVPLCRVLLTLPDASENDHNSKENSSQE
jgi:hypothetical protein